MKIIKHAKNAVITFDETEQKWRVDLWFSDTDPEPDMSFMSVEYFDVCYIVKDFLED